MRVVGQQEVAWRRLLRRRAGWQRDRGAAGTVDLRARVRQDIGLVAYSDGEVEDGARSVGGEAGLARAVSAVAEGCLVDGSADRTVHRQLHRLCRSVRKRWAEIVQAI